MNEIDIITIFCKIDQFCENFETDWNSTLMEECVRARRRKGQILLSEIMTILILFHTSGMKTFKQFYLMFSFRYRYLFPRLVSYSRFVELTPSAFIPLTCFVEFCKGECTGISIVDSTPFIVCHNKRIFNHKVFDGIAKRGKSTMGWFFGLKLHVVINHLGEILAFKVTPANMSDTKVVDVLSKNLTGKLFGDKGYIGKKLFRRLLERGLQLVTQIRSNMKNQLMDYTDRLTLRKRSLVESVFHIFKDILSMDHTRHRSPMNFLTNLVGGLAAYCLSDRKPKMKMEYNCSGEFKIL
jgi:hypothetical protein